MVETSLVTANRLETELRDAGRLLLSRLDNSGAQIVAAFWLFIEEEETWRLVLATPLTDSEGPLYVYGMVRVCLRYMSEEERAGIELSDISVVSPSLRAVQELYQQYGAVAEESKRRVRQETAPYIYRLKDL